MAAFAAATTDPGPEDPAGGMGRLRGVRLVLTVPNPLRSATWYRDCLGFQLDCVFQDRCFISRDAVKILLAQGRQGVWPRDIGQHAWCAYIHVQELDAFYRTCCARGVAIPAPPVSHPWGMRELVVQTPDGHRLVFGEPLGSDG